MAVKKFLAVLFALLIFLTGIGYAAQVEGYHVIDVPYISQLYPVRAVVGCEPTALLMGLKYKGVAQEIDLRTFLDNMPKTATDPAKGFAGSPYQNSEVIRTTIYPKALSDYANTYAQDITRDISGADLEEIKGEIMADNPVLIYATMYWKKPYYQYFNIEGQRQYLLRNNHAILLTRYDAAGRKFYVADPYNKNNVKSTFFYWVNEDVIKPVYDERRWAIVVGNPPGGYWSGQAAKSGGILRKTDHGYESVTSMNQSKYNPEELLFSVKYIQELTEYEWVLSSTEEELYIYADQDIYVFKDNTSEAYKNSQPLSLQTPVIKHNNMYYLPYEAVQEWLTQRD